MTHDGMWFFHCLQEFGIAAANKLNKSAIKSLSSIEIKRLRKTLGFEQGIQNFTEFKTFFDEASKLVIPDFMNATFSFPEDNKMAWAFEKGECFAYAGIKRIGAIEKYECGVLFRIKCWMDALGVKNRFDPEIGLCHRHHSGSCSGELQFSF